MWRHLSWFIIACNLIWNIWECLVHGKKKNEKKKKRKKEIWNENEWCFDLINGKDWLVLPFIPYIHIGEIHLYECITCVCVSACMHGVWAPHHGWAHWFSGNSQPLILNTFFSWFLIKLQCGDYELLYSYFVDFGLLTIHVILMIINGNFVYQKDWLYLN